MVLRPSSLKTKAEAIGVETFNQTARAEIQIRNTSDSLTAGQDTEWNKYLVLFLSIHLLLITYKILHNIVDSCRRQTLTVLERGKHHVIVHSGQTAHIRSNGQNNFKRGPHIVPASAALIMFHNIPRRSIGVESTVDPFWPLSTGLVSVLPLSAGSKHYRNAHIPAVFCNTVRCRIPVTTQNIKFTRQFST